MLLRLTINSYQRMSSGQQPMVELRHGSLSVGRASGNGWVLHDPRKFISNRHFLIDARGDGFYLTDTSSNGVYLNHRDNRLPRGKPARIDHGDVLLMGDFEIEVQVQGSRSSRKESAAVEAPLDADRHSVSARGAEEFRSLSSAASGGVLEETNRHEPAAEWPGPDAGREQGTGKAPLDRIPDASSVSGPSHGPEEGGGRAPVDSVADQMKERRATASAGDQADAALGAFLEGAGISRFSAPSGRAEQLLQHAGRVFRALIGGYIDALRARTVVKGEMRFDQTMLRPIENNPLKFSIDFEGTLKTMLTEKRGGCLSALDAVREASSDLVTHNLAMAAAQQEVLRGLLRRFDPAEIELMDEGRGILQELVHAARKARYWDEYKDSYARLARELEEDGGQFLAKEYARAYEEQVRLITEKRARQRG